MEIIDIYIYICSVGLAWLGLALLRRVDVLLLWLLLLLLSHLSSLLSFQPDNIGFDVRGDIKIFDFGLAKELHENEKDKNGLYKLTADTGSPRYMAPEVCLGKPYNETCDVYSFSILAWQMLKAETPFELYQSVKSFRSKVMEGGVRPGIDPKWPADIADLLRRSWSPDIPTRPSMDDVCEGLRAAINRDTDEELVEIMDASRRSEISLVRDF